MVPESRAGPESRPDPPAPRRAASWERRAAPVPAPAPAPAPHPLAGKNSSAAGVSARPRIWLPRAGIERLQPPPSLQTGSAGGHAAVAAAPAAPRVLLAFGKGLCAGGSLQTQPWAWRCGLPHLHQSMRETKIVPCSLRGCSEPFGRSGER